MPAIDDYTYVALEINSKQQQYEKDSDKSLVSFFLSSNMQTLRLLPPAHDPI